MTRFANFQSTKCDFISFFKVHSFIHTIFIHSIPNIHKIFLQSPICFVFLQTFFNFLLLFFKFHSALTLTTTTFSHLHVTHVTSPATPGVMIRERLVVLLDKSINSTTTSIQNPPSFTWPSLPILHRYNIPNIAAQYTSINAQHNLTKLWQSCSQLGPAVRLHIWALTRHPVECSTSSLENRQPVPFNKFQHYLSRDSHFQRCHSWANYGSCNSQYWPWSKRTQTTRLVWSDYVQPWTS